MTSLWSSRPLQILLGSLLGLATAQACGPDFFPDTFVRTSRPDLPVQFVKGRLGLLQPGFARADLFVAYRYLNGGRLDSEEQEGWSPTYPLSEQIYGPQSVDASASNSDSPAAETPLDRWTSARKKFPGTPSEPVGQWGSISVKTWAGFSVRG